MGQSRAQALCVCLLLATGVFANDCQGDSCPAERDSSALLQSAIQVERLSKTQEAANDAAEDEMEDNVMDQITGEEGDNMEEEDEFTEEREDDEAEENSDGVDGEADAPDELSEDESQENEDHSFDVKYLPTSLEERDEADLEDDPTAECSTFQDDGECPGRCRWFEDKCQAHTPTNIACDTFIDAGECPEHCLWYSDKCQAIPADGAPCHAFIAEEECPTHCVWAGDICEARAPISQPCDEFIHEADCTAQAIPHGETNVHRCQWNAEEKTCSDVAGAASFTAEQDVETVDEPIGEENDDGVFIAEESDQTGEDEVEEDNGAEAEDLCDPCDRVCVERESTAGFNSCDDDANGKLSAKELKGCMVDGASSVEVSGGGVGFTELVSDSTVASFLDEHDKDGDQELSLAEWMKSTPECLDKSTLLENEADVKVNGSIVRDVEDEDYESVTYLGTPCVKPLANVKAHKSCHSITKGCKLIQTRSFVQVSRSMSSGSARRTSRWGRRRRRSRRRRRRRRRWWRRRAPIFKAIVKVVKKVAKKVVKVVKKVAKKVVKAVKKHVVKHVVKAAKCVGSVVVAAGTCAGGTIANAANAVAQTFSNCWKEIIAAVTNSQAAKFFKGCKNIGDCAARIGSGIKKIGKFLVDWIQDALKKAKDALINKGPIGKGIKKIKQVVKAVPAVAKKVAKIALRIGQAIIDLIKDTGRAIAGEMKEIMKHMSSPGGMGLWYLMPTDCGAFGYIRDIFNIKKITSIGSNFKQAVSRLGKCLIKTPILSLPIPFMDLKVPQWTIPKAIQIPIAAIVGTMRFIFQQLKSIANGCKDNSPLCKFVKAIGEIGSTIKTAFADTKLIEQSTEIVGERVHGNSSHFKVETDEQTGQLKCAGADFKLYFEWQGSIKFPPLGDALGIAARFEIGCRNKVFYADLLFGVSGSLFLFGIKTKPVEAAKMGTGVEVGFAIGTSSESLASWSASLSLSGKVAAGGAAVSFGLSFILLPKPDYPKGFSVSPSVENDGLLLLEMESRQKEMDDAVASVESVEDKTYMAVGTLFEQLHHYDMAVLYHPELMSAIEMGAEAMARNNIAAYPYPKEAAFKAGLGGRFCITCGLRMAAKAIASGYQLPPPAPAPPPAPPVTAATVNSVVALIGGKDKRYCADEHNTIKCNRNAVGGWERFTVVNAGAVGKIGLKGGKDGRYCADEINVVKCNRGHVLGWERFTLDSISTNGATLKGGRGGRYCADEGNGGVKCNRGAVGGWEKFTVECLSGDCQMNIGPLKYGDRFIQIGDWRIGDVDGNHASISHKSGKTAQIYRHDGRLFPGPRNDWGLWNREVGKPGGIIFGDKFIQIGEWRIGDKDGTHASMSHKNGKTAQIWRSDGTRHPGPRNDWGLWDLPAGPPGRIKFGQGFIELGDWRIGAVDGPHASMAHKGGKTSQIWRDDGTLHPGPRTDWKTYDGRAATVAVKGSEPFDLARTNQWLDLVGKPASQSHWGWGGTAGRAVDGNSDSRYGHGSCTHTHKYHNAWWEVNMGAPHKVTKVKVTNRGDCCGSRLNGFDVLIDGKVCASNVGISQGQTKDVGCDATGSKVKVRLHNRNDYLTLCEVKVHASHVAELPAEWLNLRGKATSQSHWGWGGTASRAVDGNTQSRYGHGSCTHTHSYHNAWWEVNMGEAREVQAVKVTNRGDCCGHRLNGFDVLVDDRVCSQDVKISQGQTKEVKCGKFGKRLKIRLSNRKDYLTLCEVQVKATKNR